MEFGRLMTDILVNVSCKFEMNIFKIAQVIDENVRIAFLYVLSIDRNIIYLRNKFKFWSVHEINHEQTKNEFITYIYILYNQSSMNFQFSPNLAGFLELNPTKLRLRNSHNVDHPVEM